MRAALASILLVVLVACGEAAQAELPLLPTSALPELSSSTDEVTAKDLAADFGEGTKPFSGFARGRERVFQGESHDLDRVVSRTLEFDDATAAQAYIGYYHSHLALAYGPGTSASPIENDGRAGYLIDPAACACHRAEPTLAALVAKGPRVTYLEVNGGGAERDRLESLLAEAP